MGPERRRVARSQPEPGSAFGRALLGSPRSCRLAAPGGRGLAGSCIFYQGGGSVRGAPVTPPLFRSFSRLFQRTHAAASLSLLSLPPAPVSPWQFSEQLYFSRRHQGLELGIVTKEQMRAGAWPVPPLLGSNGGARSSRQPRSSAGLALGKRQKRWLGCSLGRQPHAVEEVISPTS